MSGEGVTIAAPPVGEFDREFAQRFASRAGRLLESVFRLEVQGLERLDLSRPGMLVGNHNLGVWGVLDVLAVYYAWYGLQSNPPDMVSQGEKLVLDLPYVGPLARRVGVELASLETMRAAAARGRWIYTTPGALSDQFRPFWLRHNARLKRVAWVNGRRVFIDQLGYAAVAVEQGYPIYPVAVGGTYGMSPVLWESPRLFRLLGLHRLRKGEGWPGFPITLNHLVNALLFAASPLASSVRAWALFVAANAYLDPMYTYPLFPFRVRLRFGEPVQVDRIDAHALPAEERQQRYRAVHGQVVERLEGLLGQLNETTLWRRTTRRLKEKLHG